MNKQTKRQNEEHWTQLCTVLHSDYLHCKNQSPAIAKTFVENSYHWHSCYTSAALSNSLNTEANSLSMWKSWDTTVFIFPYSIISNETIVYIRHILSPPAHSNSLQSILCSTIQVLQFPSLTAWRKTCIMLNSGPWPFHVLFGTEVVAF